MKSIRESHFLVLALLLALFHRFVAAQNTSASLNGVVTDQNGAVIPNAIVILTATTTGIELKTTTDSGGFYRFLNLSAGDYELKVSANGFQSYVRSGLRIALNEKARIDLQLKIGSTTEIKGLALEDIPHSFSLAMTYDLPFGRGQRWLNGGGVVNHLIGGWRVSSILRFSSGTPFSFSSGNCTVPSQFALACIPGVLPGRSPWAQSKDDFDPSKPLFDITAFEPIESFNTVTYYGSGARITNYRGFGHRNQDFAIFKDIRITERVNFQLRGEAFNLWNNHTLRGFGTDIAGASFGLWDGTVTAPRNIQVAGRITF
jgi:hypothetical protein